MTPTEANPDPIATLPPPRAIRDRLARAVREVEVLRGMLRLSERLAEAPPPPTITRGEGDRG
jgi:hypothetical protein